MSEAYLTLEQAAKRAEVSKKTIKKWIKDGLPVVSFNPRLTRIRVETFDRWLRKFEGTLLSPQGEASLRPGNQLIEKTVTSR